MTTNTDYNQEELLDLLCGFFTGRRLAEVLPEERETTKTAVLQMLYDYVVAQMQENGDPKDVIRLQQTIATGDAKLLDAFPESSTAFQQALLKMIDDLG